jgi:hypothetical protein
MNYKLSPSDLTFSKFKMRKYSCYLVASLTIVLLLSSLVGCSGEIKARLGEEFSLHIGESIGITGEDLGIKFVEVSEDSRCPKDVTCIWEGRVTAIVEISMDGSSQQLKLSQPGLTDAPARETYGEYEFTYKVEPYPEKAEVEIATDEYRLLLIVSSATEPLQTEADFTGWVTEIHPIGDKGTLGQILVEPHV